MNMSYWVFDLNFNRHIILIKYLRWKFCNIIKTYFLNKIIGKINSYSSLIALSRLIFLTSIFIFIHNTIINFHTTYIWMKWIHWLVSFYVMQAFSNKINFLCKNTNRSSCFVFSWNLELKNYLMARKVYHYISLIIVLSIQIQMDPNKNY